MLAAPSAEGIPWQAPEAKPVQRPLAASAGMIRRVTTSAAEQPDRRLAALNRARDHPPREALRGRHRGSGWPDVRAGAEHERDGAPGGRGGVADFEISARSWRLR